VGLGGIMVNPRVLLIYVILAGVGVIAPLQAQPLVSHLPDDCLVDNKAVRVLGIVRDTKNERLLYCELHYALNGQQWRVDYVRQQKIFATKHLDFAFGLHTPSVKQKDTRTGELRQAQMDLNIWQLTYAEANNAELKNAQVQLVAEAVIDAGFDHYVRSHWLTLESGKNIVFDFASIPHLKTIALRAFTKPLSSCDAHEQAQACIHVGANSALLRLFVGELKLVYDADKKLRLFRGVVNLQDDVQKSQEAVIEYFYEDDK
jgi:hypothetical protein